MTTHDHIEAFTKLNNYFIERPNDLELVIEKSTQHNSWFTKTSIDEAIYGITHILDKKKLSKWISSYELDNSSDKRIGVIMAGNIPMVGFHDMLSVLVSGNIMVAKLSSQDAQLIPHIAKKLIEFNSDYEKRINFVEKLENIDAVIATGSDNTARYFEQYFGKYPNIIRKNRTSIAILNGSETKEDINHLGKDIFQYYGLGCRNISKIYVPEGYDFIAFFEGIESYSEVGNHHKYRNNYDYNKSIYLVNRVTHLDNGFLLVTESDQTVSPISVLYYKAYSSPEEIEQLITQNADKLQCIVSKNGEQLASLPFGKSQHPELWDYADNVDTLKFLSTLN